MFKPLVLRIRHAWFVLTGRIILPSDIEGMSLMAQLAKTAASIAALSIAAGALIKVAQDNATSASDANAALAAADDATSQQIDAVTATINAALPAPAPVAAPTDPVPTDTAPAAQPVTDTPPAA